MNKTLRPSHPILIVDNDKTSLSSIDTILKKAGLNNTVICEDGRQVQEILSQQLFVLILLELTMPYVEGEKLLSIISRDFPETPVIVTTAKGDVDTVVRCIKNGAFDYVIKPVEQNRLFMLVKNALALYELKWENRALRNCIYSSSLRHPQVFAEIITNNSKMLSLFQYIESIAVTSEPVLITGETGVGKEMIAKAVHTLSGRKGPFIAVNMAGLDDGMFSDTLFGHARGAFTGADRVRPGLIEQAAGGTLFLDEIGDLTAASQAKLLRLIQEDEYLPLGQDTPRHSDARIMSATNRNLWSLARNNVFRSDLNYRLRTHHIHVPPLRERIDDIPSLFEHFLKEAATILNKEKPILPSGLIELLQTYSFPGNIRELRAMIFEALSRQESKLLSLQLFKKYIAGEHQEGYVHQPETMDKTSCIAFPSAKLPTLKEATALLVKEAMQRSQGNQSIAARWLGISQQAVSKRLRNKNIK